MAAYVGTCGWSYPRGAGRWTGVFYPEKMAPHDLLPFYAQYFNAVEINSSFYGPPTPDTARGWAAAVPSDFRFTAKLWQKFTHPKMFERATGTKAEIQEEDFDTYIDGIEPLAATGKLGPIVAQFPPSFRPSGGSLDYLEDLVRRLRSAGFQLAVELRQREWTRSKDADAARHLLEDEKVAWVVIDEPRFRTSIRGIPVTSDLGYFRFHGRNYEQWWRHDAAEDRYNYLYPPEEQRALIQEVEGVTTRAPETYAFYNNHYGAKAVVNALQLQLALGEARSSPPLPDSLVAAFPTLKDSLKQ